MSRFVSWCRILTFGLCGMLGGEVSASNVSFMKVAGNGDFVLNGKIVRTEAVDTCWTMMRDMNHQDLDVFLEKERGRGVRVIYTCVLLNACDENYYHDRALRDCNIVRPYMTNGADFNDVVQYDYWDNVKYVIERCSDFDIYVMLLPLGSDVYKNNAPSRAMVRIYMNLLCQKVEGYKNVGWLLRTGQDKATIKTDLLEEMESAIRVHNKRQPVTY
ncbi:MAG: DUF4038 domain-containing protein [Paludibacteraceae bacterium]|nr:DUF4038 domain-containing protein [Paludibacteraceae bacterium]